MAKERERRRDKRVDYLGAASLLVASFVEGKHGGIGLKDLVKADCGGDELLEGDLFEATVDPSSCTEVSASGLFKLLKAGSLTEAQFIGLITVRVPDARELLDAKTFRRLARTYQGTPRLTVKAKAGAQVTVQVAAEVLAAGVKATAAKLAGTKKAA